MAKERHQSCHFTAEHDERRTASVSPWDTAQTGKFSLGDARLYTSLRFFPTMMGPYIVSSEMKNSCHQVLLVG